MSEKDWAIKKAQEMLTHIGYERSNNPNWQLIDSINAWAEALREARKIEWPLKEQIEAHLTYMGAATERELPVNYDDGFRAGINWVKRLLEDKRK